MAASPDLAHEVVEAMVSLEGHAPELRAAHAKGVLCAARFTAAPGAARLSRAEHLQDGEVRAHVRFSNGVGGPETPDGGRVGRGMAVKLYLSSGTTDVVAITRDRFFVHTPQDFLAFLRAREPDPETGRPDMARIGEFLGAHPETVPAVQASLTEPAPLSWATCRYFGIHAFRLVDAAGEGRFVRCRWEPEAGVHALDDAEAGLRPRDYLREELARRLAREPAAFALLAQLAEDGDPVDDPTQPWPDDRELVPLGRLEVTALAFDRERDGDVLVFDPTRVPDGIELSDDPILRFRRLAYAASVERRTGVTLPSGA